MQQRVRLMVATSYHNRLPRADARIGIVVADGLSMLPVPAVVEARLARLLVQRKSALSEAGEVVRQAVRDLLRNGRYKPTGRGKPASEYLLRAAQAEGAFPRINAPVDSCNLISLAYVLPISLWDLDRAGASAFVFRLGRADEAYVFNAGGQTIRLEDLIVGCRVTHESDAAGTAIVNPVKDSLATKTTTETTRVAASIYAPAGPISAARLQAVCDDLAALMAACGPAVQTANGIVAPGETLRL